MIDTETSAAAAWLLNSGIQNPDGAVDAHGTDISGSFNAWFDPSLKKHSYVYSEISGYALTELVYLYSITQNQDFLHAAQRVADWLVKTQRKDGAFETAFYHPGTLPTKPAALHSFDVGMVLGGLTCMYALSADTRYIDAARRAGAWLTSIQREDGSLPAQISGETGAVLDSPRTWSTQSGSYHAKIAIGLLHLATLTDGATLTGAVTRLCEYALSRQEESGQFYTYGEERGSNLHPFLYSCEGLYVAGSVMNNTRYRDAAERGVQWVFARAQNGLVPRHVHDGRANYHERVDILSQAYRMFRIFGIGETEEAEALRATIISYQYAGDVREQHGGFLFGKQSDGSTAAHVNSWVTMFALQALALRTHPALDPFHLV